MSHFVKKYGPGQQVQDPQPGDFILTHRHRPYSFIISHGQKLRFTGAMRPYAHWSHAALCVDTDGSIIEALGKGVVKNNLTEYEHVEYHYVHVDMDDRDRLQAVKFVQACVGQKYGWGTILGLAFTLATGSKLQFGFNGTEICSGLVARALERGNFIFPKAPNTMMPADLAEIFNVLP
jgi:cell wall-associated NlpC family hydrolase